jgi:hypothetical protein
LKVVPHNREVLLDWDGHINVEYAGTSYTVLYLYKYLFKGNRKVKATFQELSESQKVDEFFMYLRGRYICSMESTWKFFHFQTYPATKPSVSKITVKLPSHVDNLLNDGWNILKPGGTILIPVDTVMKNSRGGKNFIIEDALQHQKKNLALSVRRLSDKPWLVRSHMVKDLPFVIGIKSELKHIEKYAYLSITKPRGGGGRKTRSRRSRSRTPKQVG